MTQTGIESRSPRPMTNTLLIGLCSPMAWETWVQSQVESYQRLKNCYLMFPCLTLSIIRYRSRVKQSNPGKGVALSPTPWCRSYRKESLCVTLDYSRQLISKLCLIITVLVVTAMLFSIVFSIVCIKVLLYNCLLSEQENSISPDILIRESPVSWSCRIHRLHLCRGIRYLQWESWIWLNNLMVKLQPWNFRECGVPLYWHHSLLHSNPKRGNTWKHPTYGSNRILWNLNCEQTNDSC